VSDPILATTLAILTSARDPAWTGNTQNSASWGSPPTGDASGVDLDDSPKTHLRVSLRKTNVHQRSARYTITTLGTGAGTHTVAINGSAITSASASYATIDAALVALNAAIQADAFVGQAAPTPVVNSELLDSADAATPGTAGGGNAAATLRIYTHTAGADDYAVTAFSTTMTSGVVAVDADPSSAKMRVFFSSVTGSDTNAPSGPKWGLRPELTQDLDGYGYFPEALCVGGAQKMHVWLDNLQGPTGAHADVAAVTYTGGPTVSVGPATLE